jgi:ferric iron reductase protein FhuF
MAADLVDARAVLHAAGRVGAYFETEPWRADAGWRPLAELIDGDALAERVAAGTSTLARVTRLPADELAPRVVASTVSLGLFARLVSPPVAATVLAGVVPRWSDDSLWWQPTDGGPWPLATSAADGRVVGDLDNDTGMEEAAELLTDTVVAGVVAPLLHRFHDDYHLSDQVLWGNVASALAGTMTMLADVHPDHADVSVRLVERLLDRGPLAGTAAIHRPDTPRSGPFLVRRSCCLYYRLPGAGYCADCILAHVA